MTDESCRKSRVFEYTKMAGGTAVTRYARASSKLNKANRAMSSERGKRSSRESLEFTSLTLNIYCFLSEMTTRTGLYQPTSGPALAYTLHLPSRSSNSPTSFCSKLAMIAHPYGRLGGSQHDHVVVSLARMLAEQEEYAVLRYDARGSGNSEGSGSWS